MKSDGVDLSKVVAISGDAQQHGSVFWANGAETLLENLRSDSTFFEQLQVIGAYHATI